ncbi:TetR/AcrR family transcriptional regulator [Nocardia sp. NPDC057227]|uniref:TetR/AcrR family transcriptional regulator n=1 Tax=Nocardia sp. NPDC057227 TaxID=3346056 RepID=UPI00363FFC10
MDTPARPLRADAKRNRDRILAAAAQAFADNGTDAPLEPIARAAGVGIGTLYGHFPTRRALIAALLADRNAELFATGDRLTAAPPGREPLTAWITAVIEHAATYRGLADVLATGLDDADGELHAACLRMDHIGATLLTAANAAGALPALTPADLSALIGAAAWTGEHSGAEQAARLVTLALNGAESDTGTAASR